MQLRRVTEDSIRVEAETELLVLPLPPPPQTVGGSTRVEPFRDAVIDLEEPCKKKIIGPIFY